jgi:hypothetical protein
VMWLTEIIGHFAGPWSLWQSRRRVKREGHSGTPWPVPAASKFCTSEWASHPE